MLNYIKSELYRAARSKEIHGTAIGLLAMILFMNLILGLMKNVEHFRYGTTSFSYSMLVSMPMLYCYVAADVAAMLYESHRRNGTMGNSIAFGISRLQLLAAKCMVCLVVSLVLLALALPVYITSATLLLDPAGPTTVLDMLLEIPSMSLIGIAALILAVILLDFFENSFFSVLTWLTVMLFLPKLLLFAGMLLPFGGDTLMHIAMWMPVNFIPAAANVNMSQCVTIWDTGAGIGKCLISGAAGILVFSVAGVLLLRKRDI